MKEIFIIFTLIMILVTITTVSSNYIRTTSDYFIENLNEVKNDTLNRKR
jgi:septation ring formation regulator EzrA